MTRDPHHAAAHASPTTAPSPFDAAVVRTAATLYEAAGCGSGADDHGVGDRDDLVDRQIGARRVLADRLGAGRLVDAHRADRAVALVEHVAADPADVVGHVLVADLRRSRGSLFQVTARTPAVASQDRVLVHLVSPPRSSWAADTIPRPPGPARRRSAIGQLHPEPAGARLGQQRLPEGDVGDRQTPVPEEDRLVRSLAAGLGTGDDLAQLSVQVALPTGARCRRGRAARRADRRRPGPSHRRRSCP